MATGSWPHGAAVPACCCAVPVRAVPLGQVSLRLHACLPLHCTVCLNEATSQNKEPPGQKHEHANTHVIASCILHLASTQAPIARSNEAGIRGGSAGQSSTSLITVHARPRSGAMYVSISRARLCRARESFRRWVGKNRLATPKTANATRTATSVCVSDKEDETQFIN